MCFIGEKSHRATEILKWSNNMFNYKLWIFEGSVIMVIAVATVVFYGNAVYFDTFYSGAIQGLRGGGLNTLIEGITYIGNWQSIVIICLLLLAFDKTRKTFGIPVTLVAILSSVANKIVKHLMHRPRPDSSNMLISVKGYSFPSGHTTTAIAVFVLIGYILVKTMDDKKKAWIYAVLLTLLALVIGLSRVYVGVHHPSDVFAGIFMGTASMSLIAMFFYPHKKEHAKWSEKFDRKLDSLEVIEAEVVKMPDEMKTPSDGEEPSTNNFN